MELSVKILAIESSCDDTSAAVVEGGKVVSNRVATQNIHEQYGGVVPELASRDHEKNIIPVVDAALKDAGLELSDIHAIALTAGPGLIGSLLVGVTFAKGLSAAMGIPLIEVDHLHAHLLAPFASGNGPSFPYLCLLISGGHTQIALVHNFQEIEILGQTCDDAAGEAFDKIAKYLGLGYPGGPLIDQESKDGHPQAFTFPIPQIAGFDFSFSGFKTSVLYKIRKEVQKNPDFISMHLADLCASVQFTISEILFQKFEAAMAQTGVKSIALSGGVAANRWIRSRFEKLGQEKNIEVYIPEFQYCTDNAGMVGVAGYFKYVAGDFSNATLIPYARKHRA